MYRYSDYSIYTNKSVKLGEMDMSKVEVMKWDDFNVCQLARIHYDGSPFTIRFPKMTLKYTAVPKPFDKYDLVFDFGNLTQQERDNLDALANLGWESITNPEEVIGADLSGKTPDAIKKEHFVLPTAPVYSKKERKLVPTALRLKMDINMDVPGEAVEEVVNGEKMSVTYHTVKPTVQIGGTTTQFTGDMKRYMDRGATITGYVIPYLTVAVNKMRLSLKAHTLKVYEQSFSSLTFSDDEAVDLHASPEDDFFDEETFKMDTE